MAIQRAQEDAWTKEMAKWEHRPVLVNGTYIQPIEMSQGGKKEYPFTPYPKMLYRGESADGGPRIAECKTVPDETQERLACGQGWSATQEAALEAVFAQQREFAKLAANRAYNEKWMSDKARAEAQAIDESTMEHLPEIPETPIRRKPGPKPRTAQPTTA